VSTAVVGSGPLAGLLVSDGGSGDVRLLPGRGDGFFDDSNPTIFPTGGSPGQVSVGMFGPGAGPSALVLMPGLGAVTRISAQAGAPAVIQTFPAGGNDPVSAIIVRGPGGFDDLVVLDHSDGRVSILSGGPGGPALAGVEEPAGLLSPTSLAFG